MAGVVPPPRSRPPSRLVGTSALPASADPASAATASPTGSFAAITCPTATTCFAAGSYGDAQHKYLQPLVGRLANGKWTLTRPVPTPPPDTSRGSLSGVACPTPKLCFAVGAYDTDYGAGVHNRTLIEQWNGSRSTIASVSGRPIPRERVARRRVPEPEALLRGRPVGQRQERTHGSAAPAVEREDVVDPPRAAPAAEGDRLGACRYQLLERHELLRCGHVLEEQVPRTVARRAMERPGLGRRGKPQPAQAEQPGRRAHRVSCASATSCLAVGHGGTSGEDATPTPLSLRWTGARWVIVSTPNAPRYSLYALNGVACPAGNACLSVGTTYVYDPHTFVTNAVAHAERWNGARWSEASPAARRPRSPRSNAALRTIASPAAGAANRRRGWNGSAWSAAPVPVAFGPG